MEKNIKWEKICNIPDIYLVNNFQLYSSEDLYDSYVDKMLGQLMSNSITDLKKYELYYKLEDYLKKIALKSNDSDYSDILKIIHVNIKIFSIANLGISAGLSQFKKDFIVETIIPLFKNYFKKPLLLENDNDWCYMDKGLFDYKKLLHYCLLLSIKNDNTLEEISKLITILSAYLDTMNLINLYRIAIRIPCIQKIMTTEDTNNKTSLKIKFILFCIAAAEGNEKAIDFVEYYFNRYKLLLDDIGQYATFYDIIYNFHLITRDLSNLAKCFYVMGLVFMDEFDKTPFLDYSVASMQFYKVIEVELKDKIIDPILEKIDFQIFIDYLKQDRISIPVNKESITLGSIYHIFRWVLKHWDDKELLDKQVNLIKNFKSKFNNDKRYIKEIQTIISQDNLDKYRNPPAHTKTLEYRQAHEAHIICLLFMHIMRYRDSGYVSIINKENAPFLYE